MTNVSSFSFFVSSKIRYHANFDISKVAYLLNKLLKNVSWMFSLKCCYK